MEKLRGILTQLSYVISDVQKNDRRPRATCFHTFVHGFKLKLSFITVISQYLKKRTGNTALNKMCFFEVVAL